MVKIRRKEERRDEEEEEGSSKVERKVESWFTWRVSHDCSAGTAMFMKCFVDKCTVYSATAKVHLCVTLTTYDLMEAKRAQRYMYTVVYQQQREASLIYNCG